MWDRLFIIVMLLVNLYCAYIVGWLKHSISTGKRVRSVLKGMIDEKESISQEEFVHQMLNIYFNKIQDQPLAITLVDKVYDYFHKKAVENKPDGTE